MNLKIIQLLVLDLHFILDQVSPQSADTTINVKDLWFVPLKIIRPLAYINTPQTACIMVTCLFWLRGI